MTTFLPGSGNPGADGSGRGDGYGHGDDPSYHRNIGSIDAHGYGYEDGGGRGYGTGYGNSYGDGNGDSYRLRSGIFLRRADDPFAALAALSFSPT